MVLCFKLVSLYSIRRWYLFDCFKLYSEWLNISNKLCLNVKNTKCINFRLNDSWSIVLPKVQMDGELIHFVDCHNFLGIHVDCYLKWDFHVRHVCNKISKTIGILYKLKYTVPPHILILLYNALILPYLMYGNIVWGSACKTRLSSILRNSNKLFEFVLFRTILPILVLFFIR